MNHLDALEAAAEKMFEDIVGIFEGDGIGDPELWEYVRFSTTVVRAYLTARAEPCKCCGWYTAQTDAQNTEENKAWDKINSSKDLLADFGDDRE